MLLRFGCENFRSISSYQEILLTASPRKDDEQGLTFSSDAIKEKVLPIIALYGANASGKTNVLKAIQFFCQFIHYSANKELAKTGVPKFKLNAQANNCEQLFDIDFICNETHYHYGFSILDNEIAQEWLYSYSYHNRTSRSVLFHRNENEQDTYYFGKTLKGQNKTISKITSKRSLFLSVAAKSDHELLNTIHHYFSEQFTFRFNFDIRENQIARSIEYYKLEQALSAFISNADIGAKRLSVSRLKIDTKILQARQSLEQALRNVLSTSELEFEDEQDDTQYIIEIIRINNHDDEVVFSFNDESMGTKALISLLIRVFRVLKTGGTLIVDELESSLHTLLSLKLVELFNDPSINLHQAQLLFSTHEVQLLSFEGVRRDEIWLTERCPDGATHLAPLTDYKVPKSANVKNGYLAGKFGAIPYLNNLAIAKVVANNG